MNAQFFVYILASGRSGTLYVGVTKPLGGVTEAEFTKLIDAEAQATRKAGERPATAFDRYFIVATASCLLWCSAQLEAWRHIQAIASI